MREALRYAHGGRHSWPLLLDRVWLEVARRCGSCGAMCMWCYVHAVLLRIGWGRPSAAKPWPSPCCLARPRPQAKLLASGVQGSVRSLPEAWAAALCAAAAATGEHVAGVVTKRTAIKAGSACSPLLRRLELGPGADGIGLGMTAGGRGGITATVAAPGWPAVRPGRGAAS